MDFFSEGIVVDEHQHKVKIDMDSRSGGRFNSGPREMHDVTCSDCGTQTQVPFKPSEGRPVYCKDCYQKHKPKREF